MPILANDFEIRQVLQRMKRNYQNYGGAGWEKMKKRPKPTTCALKTRDILESLSNRRPHESHF